ncbi:transposase [Candidatus Calescamantes bacterium]|nr:transposase [Candidatus Calescamantes bacterium]
MGKYLPNVIDQSQKKAISMKKNTLKRLAVALRFGLIVKRIGKVMKNEDNRGRKGYGDETFLKCVLLSPLFHAVSMRDIERKLKKDHRLVEALSLKRIPDHTSISKWKYRKGEEFFKLVLREIIRIGMRIGLIKGNLLAVDSTAIDAYISKVKENYEADKDAAWGIRKKDKNGKPIYFFGYKLHLIIDTASELPLALAILPANIHDSEGFYHVFHLLISVFPTFAIVKLLADMGYDASHIRQFLRNKNIKPVIPYNGRGHYENIKTKDPDYKKRSAVERDNNLLKKYYRLNNLQVRSMYKVTIHAFISCLSMLFCGIGKYLIGYKRFRRIY